MPELSIVVTSYNRERFLRQTLESLLSERLESCEIIVVDDASTDRTLATIAHLPVRLITHSANRGQPAAQNTGVGAATGTYVALFDSDDVMCPGGMVSRLGWLKKQSAAVVAGTVSDVIDENGKTLGSYWDVFFKGNTLIPEVVSKQYCASGGEFPSPVWLLMFRKDFLAQVGPFNEQLRVCSDNEYWHRMLEVSSIPCIDAPVARYRLHGENLCGKMNEGRFEYSPQILAENLFLKLKREQCQPLNR